MENGYYWAILDNDDPRIVEVQDDLLFLFGDDCAGSFVEGQWRYQGQPMAVHFIGGRIVPPNTQVERPR